MAIGTTTPTVADEHRGLPDGPELAEVHLHPDLEQQQDDPELGQRGEDLRVADEAEDRRPDEHARDDLADHRRHVDPLGDLRGDLRRDEDDQDVEEDLDDVHRRYPWPFVSRVLIPCSRYPRDRTVRTSSPSGAIRRRRRSTCTSSALRVGAPVGHAATGERLPTDHRAEALDHRAGERTLDRRERHPLAAEAEETVLVELGRGALLRGAARERCDPGAHVAVVGGQPDPVLEAVDAVGWGFLGSDEEQAGGPVGPQATEPPLFLGPPNQHDIHGRQPTDAVFHDCFARLNGLISSEPSVPAAGQVIRPACSRARAADDHGGGEPPTGVPPEALDRPAHGDRGDDRAVAVAHGGADARDPGLALRDRLRPAGTRTAASRSSEPPASAQARSTVPPDPASSGSDAPTGTVSRRPVGRSATATHTRRSPSRT